VGEELGPPAPRTGQKAVRSLLKLGCGEDELGLILTYLGENCPSREEFRVRLTEIAEFATALGGPAARDYFRAIRETKAVGALTDPRVFAFARSVDRHTAEWYFWAIWGTRAVPELTNPTFLGSAGFFRTIGSPATVEYFLAIRETKAAAELTNEGVLRFAESIGADAAVEFFGACWETKAVADLTAPRFLDFALPLGPDVNREYFLAMRETRAVRELTSDSFRSYVQSMGPRVAGEHFRAIHETRAAGALTDEGVLLFAESIGKDAAREYFRVLASTKAVGPLTGKALLEASGVIRSIGKDAALDYFLAAAASSTDPASAAPTAGTDRQAVPVLTLLDIPTYGGYRALTMVGGTVSFWWGMWQFAGLGAGPLHGASGLLFLTGAWVGLLAAAYLLSAALAERASEQFLARRRRLLNEHGIRWHDCLDSDRQCEVCWDSHRSHADQSYDYSRFCRCPAC
jgi:hypothetical protein